jgi:hypothetical protein
MFLIDQSGSMIDHFGGLGHQVSKAAFVADALNKSLQNLIIECTKDLTSVFDYFTVSLISYGSWVGPALGGAFLGRDLVPISELAANPPIVEERRQKVPDGAGGVVETNVRFPVYFQPTASGGTPMCEALDYAYGVLSQWIAMHPNSFPPVVLHFTDGEATDGDPREPAARLTSLATSDGNVLLLNCHVSSNESERVVFPASAAELPNAPFAHQLFEMSSILPESMTRLAQERGHTVPLGARGFVFNGGIEQIVLFLDIGTRPAALR